MNTGAIDQEMLSNFYSWSNGVILPSEIDLFLVQQLFVITPLSKCSAQGAEPRRLGTPIATKICELEEFLTKVQTQPSPNWDLAQQLLRVRQLVLSIPEFRDSDRLKRGILRAGDMYAEAGPLNVTRWQKGDINRERLEKQIELTSSIMRLFPDLYEPIDVQHMVYKYLAAWLASDLTTSASGKLDANDFFILLKVLSLKEQSRDNASHLRMVLGRAKESLSRGR